jgi:large subunit ribosomal protein L18
MPAKSKEISRKRRQRSLRKRISGTAERPRLVVFRSAKHIYAQVVDDSNFKTITSVSDLLPKKNPPMDLKKGKKVETAKQVGILIAKKCIEKGISKVVFDRAGYRYHGRISMIATGAREAGLKF